MKTIVYYVHGNNMCKIFRDYDDWHATQIAASWSKHKNIPHTDMNLYKINNDDLCNNIGDGRECFTSEVSLHDLLVKEELLKNVPGPYEY